MDGKREDLLEHNETKQDPTRPSRLRRLFVGQDGLRAGWCLLIFTAVFAAMLELATWVGHLMHHSTATTKG